MSDQDFFFDEEPVTGAGKPDKQARGPVRKPARQAPPRRATPSTAPAPFFDRRTTYAVAMLLAVIGLLAGVLVGYLYGTASVQPVKATTSQVSVPSQQVPAVAPAATATGPVPATTP